ncbi:ATP-binding protein [Vogesella sp. LIG4]|uniref:ATP-binding protein n=1 Tax=Vogesella sp. LIG4 TaxID=1192162 RepID=UPI0008201101|nr:ATP-binding protein [Vogesella sp. LIG4]SCK26475.1 Signal transduction histidine kinase [Vogesella sp. LIG4]
MRLRHRCGLLAALLLPLPALAFFAPNFSPEEKAWLATHPVASVVYDADWRPIEYIQNGKMQGLAAGYLEAITRISGLQFKRAPTSSWTEGDKALLAGSIDIAPTLSRLRLPAVLDGKLLLTSDYFSASMILVTRPNGRIYFDLNQLNNHSVAFKRGSAYIKLLRERYPGIRVVEVPSPQAALEAVMAGDADAALDMDLILEPLLRRQFYSSLQVSGVLADLPVFLAMGVRKDQRLLHGILEKSLHALTAEEANHINSDWLESSDYGAPSLRAIWGYHGASIIALLALVALIAALGLRAEFHRRKARHSEQMKASFLAVMTHEIRTPMNAILSAVELLEKTRLDDKQRNLASVARTASDSLLSLLNDILDISKLEAGSVVLETVATPMVGWAQETMQMMHSRADQKNLVLTLVTNFDRALLLDIDPTRLRQILVNLLTNAIKFTEHGGVTVTLSYRSIGANDELGVLELEVADTGIGIALNEQEAIFAPFHQADSSTTRRYGGTGLGLSISRKLAQLMGGGILLKSEPGNGAVFTVSLPAKRTSPPRDERPAAQDDASQPGKHDGRRRPTVLVIDDQPANLAMLDAQLEELGCDATLCDNSGDGWLLSAEEAFDLILLDCNLPEIDGYTLAQRIREREKLQDRHTPILAISASGDLAHQQRVMESGMDGLLPKPIRLNALQTMLELWCDAEFETAAGHAEVSSSEFEPVYIDSLNDDLDDLEQALHQQQQELARHFAHRIKGAALSTHHDTIADLATRLEQLLTGPGIDDECQPLLAALRQEALTLLKAMG